MMLIFSMWFLVLGFIHPARANYIRNVTIDNYRVEDLRGGPNDGGGVFDELRGGPNDGGGVFDELR